ncbi:putative C2 domain-containing protein [Lupinus albus]|uniref:Putative C2 domain-containing protein n=1 Tax=Lupinus albus TaxID=3870 RepID=A0A6A4R0Q0_LUPAL|nr:putative C2 domain-containing protein [Lupinus albus]
MRKIIYALKMQNIFTVPIKRRRKRSIVHSGYPKFRRRLSLRFCAVATCSTSNVNWNAEFANSTRGGAESFVFKQVSNEIEEDSDRGVSHSQESKQVQSSKFTSFQEDPIVDKLRTQLGVIHPIPSPPINRDVNGGIENWIIGLLQPTIDDLEKPDYVQRVEVKQYSLGDEPLSVRNVERKTSRSVNDLQYQIGLRYTGGARMLLMLSLKFGIMPIEVPVVVHNFDIDCEVWVKMRLIPTEPWVGSASWAFVSLPNIKFELSPFRVFNLMTIPVLSMFLTKLLTEDLPREFVYPHKIDLDFQMGETVGPVANNVKSGEMQDGKKNSVGELSVTVVDARKLPYLFYGKTDPYVILSLGDQIISSKKNSQTTVIGHPGMPIWNQDFHMLVANPKKQKLLVQVKDSLGFADFSIGTGEVDLGSLEDTVPADRMVVLQGGWGILRKDSAGEVLLRLTYKAYVEDDEDDENDEDAIDVDASDDKLSDSEEAHATDKKNEGENMHLNNKSIMDILAALVVSEEFQGIVKYETGSTKNLDNSSNTGSKLSKSPVANDESIPSTPNNSEGSALFWFAVVTAISLIIALNIGGSSYFNP